MPDWFAKTLAVLGSLSGWVFLALTAALGVVLFAPTPSGIDLQPIRREWGGWILVGGVVFGFLTIARFTQWMVATIGATLRRRRQEAEKKKRGRQEQIRIEAEAERVEEERIENERRVLAYLDTLSDEEREELQFLVENNQRTGVGALHFGVHHTLHSKGLLEVTTQILTPMKTPFTVPDFIWEELLKRRVELFGAHRPGRSG